MAVVITYSSLYSAALVPAQGRPRSLATGPSDDDIQYTVPTTVTGGDAGSIAYLMPLRSGKKLVSLQFDCAALASSNLDMDLVLRQYNADGTFTDSVLYNAGTAFTSAHTNKWVYVGSTIGASRDGVAHLIAYVNVTGGTPASGAIKLVVKVH